VVPALPTKRRIARQIPQCKRQDLDFFFVRKRLTRRKRFLFSARTNGSAI